MLFVGLKFRGMLIHGYAYTRVYTVDNNLSQGSVLSCILFNLHAHDLPRSKFRKFLYVDDKADVF